MVPEPGLAAPFVSAMAWDAPLQLAAMAAGAVASSAISIPTRPMERRFMITMGTKSRVP